MPHGGWGRLGSSYGRGAGVEEDLPLNIWQNKLTETFDVVWFADEHYIAQFAEGFENNWFVDTLYNLLFIDDFGAWALPGDWDILFPENFESSWFDNNLYNLILIDNFEGDWFANNPFVIPALADDLESAWFADNPFDTPALIEDFETGDW